MLKITHGEKQFEAENIQEGLALNQEIFKWDLQPDGAGRFHALYRGKSYRLEVVNADFEEKVFTLKINGQILTFQAQDRMDMLLNRLGLSAMTEQKLTELKAPMPGLVLDLLVAPGQEVQKGDALLILEAMKMENSIKCPGDAVVKEIKVEKGQSVEKNQVLITFE